MAVSEGHAEQARRVLSLLDLTELGDEARDDDVRSLCSRATSDHGHVAAVCVWPRFVELAVAALAGSGVRVATVTNFPSGALLLGDVVAQTASALDDGADEIDVVLPYRAVVAGDLTTAEVLLDSVRRAVPRDGSHLLKVILETGELGDSATVDVAARLAIRCGADFIKTSTGKTPRSASLKATAVMLAAIQDLDPRVGLKASGGIRTLDDARSYLAQADETMGPDWVSPRTFRFGASGLLAALVAEIESGDDDSIGDETREGY